MNKTHKTLIVSILALSLTATAAYSAGYGIIGGLIVKPDGQATAVISFDGTELFLSEADCEIQRQAYVTATIRKAGSNVNGVMPPYASWYPQQVSKVDATKCIRVTPY